MENKWNKIYNLSLEDRRKKIEENINLSDISKKILNEDIVLTNKEANILIENQISVLGLPLGIATNFLIDNEEYIIPMATEEPSVIAAASNAGKIIYQNGGFKTTIHNREMIGQIIIQNATEKLYNELINIKENIINYANTTYPSIIKRGGGVRDIKIAKKEKYICVYMYIDTKEAMGANIINTILEETAKYLTKTYEIDILMNILSNYATECLVTSECSIDIKYLSEDREEARLIAKNIQNAIEYANIDVYRAVTNNKGIMNGIDAMLIALGNDYRAIDAGIHAYASKDGQYKSLTKWQLKDDTLYGSITLPLPLATVGGSIKINPATKLSFDILNNPNAIKLMSIVSSVGLAQNFAAIKALTTTGIQKGHMQLHYKSLAYRCGATDEYIDKILLKCKELKNIDTQKMLEIIKEIKENND